MRRLTFYLLPSAFCLLVGTAAFADDPPSSAEIFNRAHAGQFRARHLILDPQHPLSEAERAELADEGVTFQQALPNGRMIVRLAPGSAFDASDPRVRSLEPLTAERKLQRSAYREAAAGKAFGKYDILFPDDVSLEEAREAIANAGGALEDPMTTDFGTPRVLSARIPPSALQTLADDERVLMVRGALRMQPKVDNATTRALTHVNVIEQAPYGLTGAGVAISFFELAPVDTTHPEFEGRVSERLSPCASSDANCNDTNNRNHATHVSGTMVAAGIDPNAKGMAPKATLTEFPTSGGYTKYLKAKETTLPTLGVVADNNSWAYPLGWREESPPVWDETEIYYGGYDGYITAPLDKITRSANVLFMHSAGNDAEKFGPTAPPFAHKHVDENGDATAPVYCYSANGSGTDCPTQCTQGTGYCEVNRHPFTPFCASSACSWGSIGVTASAKNIMAVGAVDANKHIAYYSSRGPAQDGRVKPDVVSRGGDVTTGDRVYSTFPNNSYGRFQGTSMSSPAVTGISALLVEQWRKTFGGASPRATALKALMIAGAEDLGLPGPDYTYGFGFVDAKAAVDLIIADGGNGKRVRVGNVTQGQTVEVPMTLTSSQSKLRIVLGWADPEVLYLDEDQLGNPALVNDLDVSVIDPSGATVLPYVLDKTHPESPATRGVNTIDNTEEIEIANAGTGTYKVRVSGTRITASSPQEYVLVTSADLGASAAPCTDVQEPNNSADVAYGYIPSAQKVNAALCEASDVDYFKFRVTAPGTVSVKVTATGTPLRATLSSSALGSPVTADIAANTTGTVSANFAGSTPTDFVLKIEPAGALGTTSAYSFVPTYGINAGTRRRSTGH